MSGEPNIFEPLQLAGVRAFLLEAGVRAKILRRMRLPRVKEKEFHTLGGEIRLQLIQLRHFESAHRAGHRPGHHHHMAATAKITQPDDLPIQRFGFELRRGNADLRRHGLARIGGARPGGELY